MSSEAAEAIAYNMSSTDLYRILFFLFEWVGIAIITWVFYTIEPRIAITFIGLLCIAIAYEIKEVYVKK